MSGRFLYSIFFNIILTSSVFSQSKQAKVYLERAETMYHKVWQHYRSPGYEGLFKENFPSGRPDTLHYFQGQGVTEKEVSFLWPFSGVFSATNALMNVSAGFKSRYRPYQDSLVVGVEQYGNNSRQPFGYQAYPVKLEPADRYYDDNGLVGIDYMESYFITRNPEYLERAKRVFKFIKSGWNEDAGGGVTWLEGHSDQKPACSNGMAALTALKIYQGCKDTYYLNEGLKFYNWMYTRLKDTNGIIANDIKPNGRLDHIFWTYNTGSVIEAAVLLYRFTREKKYLDQAQQLAADSYAFFTDASHDKNLSIAVDLPWFVTVLFRGYETLYKVDHNYKYLEAIEKSLNYAWENSRDRYGFITHNWLPQSNELNKPKWLLDEACIAELYARLSQIRN